MAIISEKLIKGGEPADDAALSTSVSNFTPTENTVGGYIEGIDITLGTVGGGGGAIPGATIPDLLYVDSHDLKALAGRYPKGGHRFRGQYQDLTNLGSYWDLSSNLSIDTDSARIGGKVNSSWYKLYMTASDTVIMLPMIRVDTITWNDPNTEITPASHADGTTQEDGFVSANDVFNDYRLVLFKIGSAYDGTVYTIADSVDGTPDQLMITGDKTSEIAAGDWLVMVPASSTACCEIGTVMLDPSGNLEECDRAGWAYTWQTNQTVAANKNSDYTAFANTEMAAALPPTARAWLGYIDLSSVGTTVTQIALLIAWGSTNNVSHWAINIAGAAATYHGTRNNVRIPLTQTGKLRNVAYQNNGASFSAATSANFVGTGWEE